MSEAELHYTNAAIRRDLIDQAFMAGLIALVGCAIAAALAIRPPMMVGGIQPTSTSWLARPDQPAFSASYRKPHEPPLFSAVNAPAGQGWG